MANIQEPHDEIESQNEEEHSLTRQVHAKRGRGRPKKVVNEPVAQVTEENGNSQMRAYLEAQRTPVQERDLDEVVGPADPEFGATWMQQDEDAMMIEWNASPEKRAIESAAFKHGSNLSMWKVCLRIFRCTPIDLISPRRGLSYQPPPNSSESVIFSQEFCSSLSALIAHPVWKGRAWRLARALQYVVICRLDDRRPWRVEPLCPALSRLARHIDKVKGQTMPKPIHELHCDARKMANEKQQDPSLMSDLLARIGEVVCETGAGKTRTLTGDVVCKGVQVYPVTVRDLKLLVQAIDTVTTGGAPMLCPVEQAYEAFKVESGSNNLPIMGQLREFYERSARHQLRLLNQQRARPYISQKEPEDLVNQSQDSASEADNEDERNENVTNRTETQASVPALTTAAGMTTESLDVSNQFLQDQVTALVVVHVAEARQKLQKQMENRLINIESRQQIESERSAYLEAELNQLKQQLQLEGTPILDDEASTEILDNDDSEEYLSDEGSHRASPELPMSPRKRLFQEYLEEANDDGILLPSSSEGSHHSPVSESDGSSTRPRSPPRGEAATGALPSPKRQRTTDAPVSPDHGPDTRPERGGTVQDSASDSSDLSSFLSAWDSAT